MSARKKRSLDPKDPMGGGRYNLRTKESLLLVQEEREQRELGAKAEKVQQESESTYYIVSVRDFTLLVATSAILSSFLFLTFWILGLEGFIAKSVPLSPAASFLFLTCLLSFISYLVLRRTAHFLVYFAFVLLSTILHPCDKAKARRLLQRVFPENPK